MRDRNERLVLTILRRVGPMSKAEIARKTGLSAQTVSVIMRALERDGLLEKGEKQRGKIGQPSVPMRLAPNGAYFLGLKVGRRSAELILVDFVGKELAHITQTYSYPTPAKTLEFVQSAATEISQKLPTEARGRISGMGIASPYFLWEWANVIGVAPDAMADWQSFDLQSEIGKLYEFPVFLGNDATSACGAELTFGTTETPPDFLYIYIGHFVGGGVVLNGAVYPGRSGNAGAIGPFPVGSPAGAPTQLVDTASLIGLERRLSKHVDDPNLIASPNVDWHKKTPEILEDWLADAVPSLAQFIVGACAIIDFPSVLIDGNMPPSMRALIVTRVSEALYATPTSGLVKPKVVAGSLGPKARPLGAASLALSKKFMLES
ncbi:MAG: ROK family transcriptional regulator [Pseudomonadota bacterium]